jgi:Flp pilus assembly protein TadD/TolB-like protein
MRSWRWAHAVVVLATVTAVASGQPTPDPTLEAPLPEPPGAGSAGPPVPAGSSAVESMDVPEHRAGPARFAVVPFENRSGVRAFDWLIAGAPFEIASKTESVIDLESTGGPMFVGASLVPAEAMQVAAFAAQQDAQWVITGWVERPNWELRISLALWKVTKGTATLVHEAQRTGPVPDYHKLLGDALGEVWAKGGMKVDAPRTEKLQRSLASDLYAVTLMGRGLGHLTGVLTPPLTSTDPVVIAKARTDQLKLAEHDLERAVFIDPKCFEAQRLVGELYVQLAVERAEPKLAARGAGQFAYAHDLAPDDLQSLRAAAYAAARANKHEVAKELMQQLVTRRPWDLEARYRYGAALWETGDVAGAERQLKQVTDRMPDHLAARRVLVLIHSSRSDTRRLVSELEEIAARAPTDLEVKADLATAYGALGRWDRSTAALEAIALARPPDLALLMRIGDGHRRLNHLDVALTWYARAGKLVPDSSYPGFATAQALLDAGKLTEANRAYTFLQKHKDDLAAAEQALGVIALVQGRANEAAWYLRKATREAPRSLLTWRALVAAELARKDGALALNEVVRALPTWPRDGQLHYLAGVAHAMLQQRTEARTELVAALDVSPDFAPARAALGALDAGGAVTLGYTPEIVRPWGNADELQQTLERYLLMTGTMATVRASYEVQFLSLLGMLGRGPYAPTKGPAVRSCPIGRVAPAWAAAQIELHRYERLGVDLEAAYRYLERHEEAGAAAGLLPNARAQLLGTKKTFRTALADISELRAQWTRGLGPELKAVGCNDKLLAAAVKDPARYRVIVEDKPEALPEQTAPRARPRATFYVDNSRCVDPVDVWIDGSHLGQVAPGRRSALVADGGERTLCLLGPGSAQCGDRGTVRQVYLHDGWSVTLHCPK